MKTEFKGTKGEWKVDSLDDTFITSKENGCFIATINDANYAYDEKQANAKLISCSPEMLQIIKLMVNEFEYENCTQYEFELIYKARKLIEKATTI